MPNLSLAAIVKHCDQILRTSEIGDYDGAVNGLQMENSGSVTRIAATVSSAAVCSLRLSLSSVVCGSQTAPRPEMMDLHSSGGIE